MQSFEIHLPKPKKAEYVNVFSWCCMHLGHISCDIKKALKYRDYILNTPDTYVFSLGDDFDNALPMGDAKHSAMMWDNNMSPQEQFDAALKFWEPVIKEGKLLWTNDSNHFYRSEMLTGISLAKQLNVFMNNAAKTARSRGPEWGRWQAFVKLHVGKNVYRIHAWHGSGGSGSPEGALKKCRSQAMVHRADLYCMGHVHRKITDSDLYFDWPDGEKEPIEKKRVYAVTGSFLDWRNSYAERAGYAPSIRGAVMIEFGAKRWDIRVST